MASWKITPDPSDEHTFEYTPFLLCRKFFAVDDSGSTSGSIQRQQQAFVKSLRENYANPADAMSLWGSECDAPTQAFEHAQWRSCHGGTEPSKILKHAHAVETIKRSDVWFLLTDGEIWDNDVHRLAHLAQERDVLGVPLVFVITGSCGKTPSNTNISVGISFFASSQDTLILFKETSTGKIFVIAGKGCFGFLVANGAAQHLENWNDMPVFDDEAHFFSHCNKVEVQVIKAESRKGFSRGISLGEEWEAEQGGTVQVDLELLLRAGLLPNQDVFSLLRAGTFDTLAVACKTRSRIPDLRTFLQKQKVEQVAPKLEDVAGAREILEEMANEATSKPHCKDLQQRLRDAHAKNRKHYHDATSAFAGSETEQRLKKRNQAIDAALRSLASIEAAGFSAEILARKSNRARRAEVVDSASAIDIAKLNLEAPSYKGFCLVCCGDDEVMSICFKEPDDDHAEDNTTDFALNFPLAAGASTKNVALVSSQNICFQCALASPSGKSIYNEPLTAVVPVLQYDGCNKKYMNDQLYLALTGGLSTGAAGIGQLVMAILVQVLGTKSWAGAGPIDVQLSTTNHDETVQRRDTFQWMLSQLVQDTRTREDFKETGDWVKFPRALEWVATDFETNGLASFAVTYPVLGFDTLLTLGHRTNTFSAEVEGRLRSAKTVYSIAAKFLAELQTALQDTGGDGTGMEELWKQKYLEVVYQNFNGSLVPTDQGGSSIVTDYETFKERLSACICPSQLAALDSTSANGEDVMRRIQLVIFWLLFRQRGHCTAQTFFTKISQTEQLARAVLDPALVVPASEHRNVLLAIFVRQNAQLINPDVAGRHCNVIPFASPFGASVLRCGAETCHNAFCALGKPEEVTSKNVSVIRERRTKHLIEVFGIRGRFEDSITGLPERPEADKGLPPTSLHMNLHISIARQWAEQSQEQRRMIVYDESEREDFILRVRKRLCKQGRGNVFQSDLDNDIRILLPSFFEVLGRALKAQRKAEKDIWCYEHDFAKNTMEDKVRWELEYGC